MPIEETIPAVETPVVAEAKPAKPPKKAPKSATTEAIPGSPLDTIRADLAAARKAVIDLEKKLKRAVREQVFGEPSA